MKNKLWIFGDSFSSNFEQNDWAIPYINFKGYIPKVFGAILADNLNMDLINFAKGANNNITIFEDICNISDKVQPNDIIIIGWSHPNRFRIVDKNDKWLSILSSLIEDYRKTNLHNLKDETLIEICENRMHTLYGIEVNNWIKLINLAFKNNIVIHWSWFTETGINVESINYLSTITKETKGKIIEIHYSETGHVDLAKLFLKKIENKVSLI